MKSAGLIFVLFVNFLMLSCAEEEDSHNIPVDIEEEQALENPPDLNIRVDPRIELLAVVQHFTTWADKNHTRFDIGYKHDIDDYFSKYKNHSAVQKSQLLTNSGFTYDAPVAFVLYHNNPPDFEQIVPYSSYLIIRAGGESNLKDFAEKLRAFVKETNFMKFFDSKKKFYNHLQNEIIRNVGDVNYIKILEDYYGEKKHSYNIIPAPLFHSGGYGPKVSNGNEEDIYNIIGPHNYSSGNLSFGDKEDILYILLHEFSHSFINDVTEKYSAEINNSKKLYEPIKDKMQTQGYNNWQTCVNEHLVRTVVARLTLQLSGESYKNLIINKEINNGFIYILKLDSLFEDYENNRVKYPDFKSFYPRIIELFNSLL